MKLIKLVGAGAFVAAAAGMLFISLSTPVEAADHTDPPDRVAAGDADDIGDLYAFKVTDDDDTDKLVVILTFAGPVAPVAEQMGTFDEDVLYEIHIDSDDDQVPDDTIDVRFATNDLGNWGLRAAGIPGSSGPIVGNVQTTLNDNEVYVWAGLREDPFFFDLTGFEETLDTGTLSFDPDEDFFAGLNITALVVEMPMAAATGGSATSLDIWATTARFNG